MMVVVVDEEVLISLMMPKQSVGKSRRLIWVLAVVHRGKSNCYIALTCSYNIQQHGAVGYCGFFVM